MKKRFLSLLLTSCFVFSCYRYIEENPGIIDSGDRDGNNRNGENEGKKYKITFDVDGKITEKFFLEGAMPSFGDVDPVKESTESEEFTFSHWEPALTSVTSEATYKAVFDSSVRKYLITFKNGDEVLSKSYFEYGTMPVYEADVTRIPAEFTLYTYRFGMGAGGPGYLYALVSSDAFPTEKNVESSQAYDFYSYNQWEDKLRLETTSTVRYTLNSNNSFHITLYGESFYYYPIPEDNLDGFSDMMP